MWRQATLNGDGIADLIVGSRPMRRPAREVFDGDGGDLIYSFFAYGANFTGGVRVATGMLTRMVRQTLLTGAGPGGGPHVKVFDGATGPAC